MQEFQEEPVGKVVIHKLHKEELKEELQVKLKLKKILSIKSGMVKLSE